MNKKMDEYILNKLKQHGENGDKSFECFGFTIEHGKLINVKCYQLAALNLEIITMEQLQKLRYCVEDYETLFEKKYIRVFGISGKSQQGIDSSRLSIRINNRLDFVSCREITFKLLYGENEFFKNIILQVDSYIRKLLETSKYTLEQIGYELNQNGEVKERKIYFSLYKFNFRRDVCGSFADINKYTSLFSLLLDLFDVEKVVFEKMCIAWIKSGFMPIMFGINHNSRNIQLKFYYLCPDDDREIKSFGKFIYACDCENIDTDSIKGLKKIMDKYDLYLKGFAYCVNVGDGRTYIKPYFYPNGC